MSFPNATQTIANIWNHYSKLLDVDDNETKVGLKKAKILGIIDQIKGEIKTY